MDVLVGFCRTGRLGPIVVGLNAIQLEELLGPPDSTHEVHGEPNRQRYRYGTLHVSLSGNFSADGDRSRLTIESFQLFLSHGAMNLPDVIAKEVTFDWETAGLDQVMRLLQTSGVRMILYRERHAERFGLVRQFNVGDAAVMLTAVNDEIDYIERLTDLA